MQISIELPDKLAKELDSLYKEKDKQKNIIQQAIKEKLERIKRVQKDPFIKWLLNDSKKISSGLTDVSVNHDKYLYGK